MLKRDKEAIAERLTERLRAAETLFVADYRGLTNAEIDGLRTELLKHGARFTVVKNTLTRRAAEASGKEGLLALLEGPTAIAFLEADGDAVAVAKALSDFARESKILAVRGGIMEARPVSSEEVERLAKLPPLDVLRGQVVGAIVAPIQVFAGLVAAPLQSLHGLIDARIAQLEEQGEGAPAPEGEASPAPGAAAPAVEEEAVQEETTAASDAPASDADQTQEEEE